MGHKIKAYDYLKASREASRELRDMPLTSDMTGEGAGRNLGSPAHRFGAMKGDQSGTHRDYVNFKDTDPKYHGHTGASHGDQSATHLDYLKSSAKNLGSPAKQRPNYYPKEENVVYTEGGRATRRKNLEAEQKKEDAAKK